LVHKKLKIDEKSICKLMELFETLPKEIKKRITADITRSGER
jgi:hypothetical protein